MLTSVLIVIGTVILAIVTTSTPRASVVRARRSNARADSQAWGGTDTAEVEVYYVRHGRPNQEGR